MISEKVQYLFDRGMFGMKMGLRNITDLLEFTKTPWKDLRTVHVAGTNGKGSVSNIIARVLTANGYRTGLFTSPHLVRFNERIKIDGDEITDTELGDYISFFREGIEKYDCTFFEANTAIAFRYFLDKKVDIAVIETGLGGRLDSTNIITPELSVITGIDLDHQKQLGNSVVQIAREKAGIIKPGIPVVANIKRHPALKVIRRTASKKGSELILADRRKFLFGKKDGRLSVSFFFKGERCGSVLRLMGDYQKDNVVTAVTALRYLSGKFSLDPEKTASALSVVEVAGRMQTVSEYPRVIIDAAHNMEGLRALKNELDKIRKGTVHLIFGTVKDKDHEKIIRYVSEIRARKYYTRADNKRALGTEIFRQNKYAANDPGACFFDDPEQAYNQALKNCGKEDVVVITGSHYLIGDILNRIKLK